MTPRRILHSEASLGFGGQEKRILRELQGLDSERFQGMVLCRPGARLSEAAARLGIPAPMIEMRASFDPVALGRILWMLRRERVELIHTHSSRDGWLLGMAGKLAGIPVVRTRHLRTPIGGPFVYHRLADRVVTVSDNVRDYLIAEGVPANRVETVYTGVDLQRLDPDRVDASGMRARFGLEPEDFVVGVVAVLRQKKGHRYLIRAVDSLRTRYPRLRLLIAGDGPIRFKLDALVAELGLEGVVRLAGNVTEVPELLKSLDMFVFPSLQEALGTAVLEAQAMGVPVAATAIDGIPEAVGEAGLLFPPEDPAAIAHCIERVMTAPELAAQLRHEGMAHARARFDQNRMIRRMEAIYAALLKEKDS